MNPTCSTEHPGSFGFSMHGITPKRKKQKKNNKNSNRMRQQGRLKKNKSDDDMSIKEQMRAILQAQGKLKKSKYTGEGDWDVDCCKGCDEPTMEKCDECGNHCCKKNNCLVECVDSDNWFCEECAEEAGIFCQECGNFSCCEIECSICEMNQ